MLEGDISSCVCVWGGGGESYQSPGVFFCLRVDGPISGGGGGGGGGAYNRKFTVFVFRHKFLQNEI